jgi:hypothetical protein
VTDNEALLLLIGVPAVVVAVVWALAWRGGPGAEKRYRPGRPYEFATVWFLANHRTGPATAGELAAAPSRVALPTAAGRPEDTPRESVGGASESW